jgi:hypothetical protein
MNSYEETRNILLAEPSRWLITGVAGFIGSNLLEALLKLNQRLRGPSLSIVISVPVIHDILSQI